MNYALRFSAHGGIRIRQFKHSFINVLLSNLLVNLVIVLFSDVEEAFLVPMRDHVILRGFTFNVLPVSLRGLIRRVKL